MVHPKYTKAMACPTHSDQSGLFLSQGRLSESVQLVAVPHYLTSPLSPSSLSLMVLSLTFLVVLRIHGYLHKKTFAL